MKKLNFLTLLLIFLNFLISVNSEDKTMKLAQTKPEIVKIQQSSVKLNLESAKIIKSGDEHVEQIKTLDEPKKKETLIETSNEEKESKPKKNDEKKSEEVKEAKEIQTENSKESTDKKDENSKEQKGKKTTTTKEFNADKLEE